ncbi:MAG: glycosyltransferase [Nitrospirae bacterium]|nr:glycosyltransferase [Nitrospirota bacterium]
MAAPPRISIVTPCLNRAGFIRAAVESVLAQHYPNVEHLIADGGSTDGTLEILAEYPHLQVVSEPDLGLYDALNKAVARATGDVIGHLNSDDLYPSGCLHAVAAAFAAAPDAGMVAGGAELLAARPGGGWQVVCDYPAARHAPLSLREITIGAPIINARFFRRAVYARVGGYDPAYPIAADRDFLLRAAIAGVSGPVVPQTLYQYRAHAGSLTMQAGGPHALACIREYLRMAERYLADPAMPAHVRAACRRWHGKAAIDGALEALRDGRPGDALRFAWAGWRHAPLFPAALGGSILWRLARMPLRPMFKGRM